MCSRKLEVCEQAAREIEEEARALGVAQGECVAARVNIRDAESVAHCVDWVLSRFGRVDCLVNNAGGQFVSAAEGISEGGFRAVVDLNLTGSFRVTQCVFKKAMKAQRAGSVVNITASFFHGAPLMMASGCARMGVTSLTVSLAQEWAKYNVRVNSVAPGFIDSSGLRSYPKPVRDALHTHTAHNYCHRMGTVREVADCVLFLLSDGASFITGQHVHADAAEHRFNPLCPPSQPLARL